MGIGEQFKRTGEWMRNKRENVVREHRRRMIDFRLDLSYAGRLEAHEEQGASKRELVQLMQSIYGNHYLTNEAGLIIRGYSEPSIDQIRELLESHQTVFYAAQFEDGSSFRVKLNPYDL